MNVDNKKSRLTIQEIAATDKENVASKLMEKKLAGSNAKASYSKIIQKNDSDTKVKPRLKNINNKKIASPQSVTASDLIVDNPSENYWRKLAEGSKKALRIALKENNDLHNKVIELEYENSRLKAMLNETKSLVEVLTEMIEENDSESSVNETDQPSESLESKIIKLTLPLSK